MQVIVLCFLGLLGLAIGSFLNVVIYRVPRGLSIVAPRSVCTACGVQIAAIDNIPLFSWVWLRGRCRSCKSSISSRYPLVELGTGVLFVGAATKFGFHWYLPAFIVYLTGLFALAWIDFEHLILPKRIVYPVTSAVVALLMVASVATHEWRRFLVAAICALVWFGVFLAINLISPRSLGFGDVRLAPLLGVGLGWLGASYAVLGFFLANLLGALVGLGLVAAKRIDRRQRIPYGVFLAAGAAFVVFFGSFMIPHLHRFL